LLETINTSGITACNGARWQDALAGPPRAFWNANFIVSNWILFSLQLHSDHHAHMERPCEELESAPSAPQLPAGYGTMVLLAWLPPAWFAVMNPRLPASA
jgi:alkane 1-monooxygenase